MIGKSFNMFLGLWVILFSVLAQNPANNANVPVFSPTETSYDFGTIGENDGYAEHFFSFKNTGTAPLVISRVTASCGCTRPEWPSEPIEPGKEGVIIISYNPKGRLGPIHKIATVYTNENNGFKRHNLTILGQVVEKPSDPAVAFNDTIGGMGIENKHLTFRTFSTSTVNKIAAYIKNYNAETVYFSWENIPDYVTIQAPDSLKADWPGEIIFAVDGSKNTEKRGRVTDKCTWIIKNKDGKILGSEQLLVSVNYIDDFSKLSPLQTVSAATLEIQSTILDFGEIKKSGLGLSGRTANRPVTLTNTGKSDLIIHSLTVDDERVHLPDLKGKTIKAGESFTVQATVKAKDFNSENLDTEIYVVCNDPKGPVRRIKVTADKIN